MTSPKLSFAKAQEIRSLAAKLWRYTSKYQRYYFEKNLDWQTSHKTWTCAQTVNALLSMLVALMYNTSSADVFSLSMGAAYEMAIDAGITEEEWNRVSEIVKRRYKQERRKNPISAMF